MSIIEEQTENVIIESDPDEPDNQPNEHPNGQLNVIFQNNRILIFQLFRKLIWNLSWFHPGFSHRFDHPGIGPWFQILDFWPV